MRYFLLLVLYLGEGEREIQFALGQGKTVRWARDELEVWALTHLPTHKLERVGFRGLHCLD